MGCDILILSPSSKLELKLRKLTIGTRGNYILNKSSVPDFLVGRKKVPYTFTKDVRRLPSPSEVINNLACRIEF